MAIFSTDTIVLDSEADSKEGVMTQLARCIERAGKLVPGGFDNYMLSLEKREKEFSTAVGYDYAIPHGKSDAVAAPAVAFARLKKPILWDKGEDDWAQNVFMIAVPAAQAGDEHMKLLMKLAGAIIDDDFRARIAKAVSSSDVIDIITNIQ